MPKEPLPEGKVILKDGKYVFLRGEVVIDPKVGLDHPLRNRKKKQEVVIHKVSEPVTVTFE
jgi:hypothetical protein